LHEQTSDVNRRPFAAAHKIVSVGIASFGRDPRLHRSEMPLEYADRALYRAKADGRNLVVRASALFRSPTEEPSTVA
jgi:GGDEF domain-containing protein